MRACATTCPYCGVGCGVAATVDGEHVLRVTGDGNHPANAGRLCVKGTALPETLSGEGRLLHPTLRGQRLAWNDALDLVATRLAGTREKYGPDAIAFYLSGQLLTEDYYVANKLMKGFLGSANVDTNSRLCMSSAVAAYQRAFGEDVVPCSYADLESCELLVMVGSNAAWTHPVIYQRIVAARQANPHQRVVVIDTRRTDTCDIADLYLQIAPGGDAVLFGGLLRHLARTGAVDARFVAAHATGLEAALAAVAHLDDAAVGAATGIATDPLQQFYDWFADTAATVTLYSQGVNQSVTGTDNCNAIINCHLATGRIGRAGAGPFSITGQPNAMGGREVGGLANQLAAHRGFTPADVDSVGRFWNAPDMATGPGLKAVDMFRAAAEGRVRFLWIMATNPVVSLPDSLAVTAALQRCDFVVVSDCTGDTDTAALADLLLPAAGWGEKAGSVTNSERVISRQRQLVTPPGEAQPDWWIVTEVARRMGFADAFNYSGPAAIFREHAALSAFENNGRRCFDIGALEAISAEDYDAMAPSRWPLPAGGAREPFTDGRFFTADGRARFVPVRPGVPQASDKLVVNTGRLRDQWHSMTRTGGVPRLARHRDFFFIGVNPADARNRGLREGDLARLHNARGEVLGVVALDDGLPRGQTWVPMHWNARFAASGRINDLVAPLTDPVSGQPQFKYTLAALAPEPTGCWGLLFSRQPLALSGLAYWSRIAVAGGFVTLLADSRAPGNVAALLEQPLAPCGSASLSYRDEARGDLRRLELHDGEVAGAVFLARERSGLPARSWICALGELAAPSAPHLLLAGFNPGLEDRGTIVCSCWEVGDRQIDAAISQGARSLESLGETLRCGTRCGSCVPELKHLLRVACRQHAA